MMSYGALLRTEIVVVIESAVIVSYDHFLGWFLGEKDLNKS